MTLANEPDIGPLTWVKSEIDQALSHASESLQSALGSTNSSAQVQFAQNHLHQVRGALSIIGLDGLTIFVTALDLFLAALVRGELPLDEAQISLGRRALASIANYLEELVHGAPDQPLRLLPLYRELVSARNETEPSPADLFFPDLSVRVPMRSEVPKLDAGQRQQQGGIMRQRFQRGLLDWLRQLDSAATDAMRAALAGLEAIEDNPGMRALWWVGQAFIDTLPASSSANTEELKAVKQLLARIESQLPRAEGGPQALPERLLRELLYHIASQPASTPTQQAVRELWQLSALIPEKEAAISDLPLGPLLEELHQQLTNIKDEWNTIGEHGTTALSKFEVQLEAFTKATAPLSRPVLYRLLGGMCRFIAWLNANLELYSEPIALEFATALLLAEAALDRGLPDPSFQTQVGDALSRLEALARGEELGAPPSATSVESARKQQEKAAVAQLSREILSDLAAIEQTLDDFFRDHSKRAPLETLHVKLHKIEGVLSLLGEGDAISLIREAGETITRLAQQDSPVDDTELTELARRFSALGFFVQSLPYNRTSVAHFLSSATPSAQPRIGTADLPKLPEVTAAPAATELQAKEPAGPSDGVEAFPPFEIETEGEAEVEISLEAPEKPAPKPVPPPVTVTASRTPAPQIAQEDIDAELLAIFIEEAHEVLKSVIDHLKLLHASPGNHENLTVIRRNFHTLKGSGRMVGLADLGEAAWGLEQTLNRWLQLEWQVTPPLLKMLAIAHREFTAWVNQIDKKAEYRRDVSALLAEAERLRNSGAPEEKAAAPTPEEVPEQPVLPAEEPEAEEPDAPPAQAVPEEPTYEFVSDAEADLDIVPLDEPEAEPGIEPEAEPEATVEETRDEPGAPEPPSTETTKPARAKRPIVPKFEPFDFSPFSFEPDGDTGGFSPDDFSFEKFDFETSGSEAPETDEALPGQGDPFGFGTDTDGVVEGGYQGIPGFPPEADQTGAEPAAEEGVQPRVAPDAETLYIGDVEISRALFELYVAEAQTHINTLHQEFDHLADNPTLLLPEASLRAAHSCAGISGTARCTPLYTLGKALELAQQRIQDLKRPPTSIELALFKASADTLDAMLTRIIGLSMPLETPELIAQLDGVGHGSPDFEASGDSAIAEAVAKVFPEAAAGITYEITKKPSPLTTSALPAPHDEIDAQLLPIFLEEAGELINALHTTLHAWSSDLGNPNHSMLVKRQLHTLKGSARMAGAMILGNRIHQLESHVESSLSAEDAAAALVDEIVASVDGIEQMVAGLAEGPVPEAPVTETGAESAEQAQPARQEKITVTVSHAAKVAPLPERRPPPVAAPSRTTAEGDAVGGALRVRAELIDGFVNDASEIGVARTRIEGELRQLRQSLLDLTENVIRLRNQLREIEIQSDVQMQTRLAQAEIIHAEFDPLEMDRYTRLQELTRMMAESVNDVTTVQQTLLKNIDNADFALHSQARITRELQQALMQVRMIPFDSLAVRLYRIVRRGARDLGKRANLDLRGGGIEIDRGVLEHIVAPLEHLLRNALAHGIEPPEVRRAKNKPEIGQITLTTRQEGNEIVIELTDDGAGLDFERIAEQARERGLLESDEIADERRLANLIFLSGFTTAEKVTAVSGRGVGMDVVRAETAAVGGRVDISSTPGAGTMFSIYLPLTLAVTQALMVRSGTQLYAIPASMISQILELKADATGQLLAEGGIEWLGRQYPYRYLPNLLGNHSARPEIGRYSWVLLLHSGAQTLALHVDALRGHQEIIVKNAGPQLTRIAGISGATVLGNGEIVLIINPVAMANREITFSHAGKTAETGLLVPEAVFEPETVHEPTIMVVDDSLTVRKVTSRLLEREGYRVITAKDGDDAIESLIDNIPDVILSDIEMPRMDGFDLVRNIRADTRLKDVPIIMITSRLADKHREYAMEIGANHYLGKPYQEEELLSLIANYVSPRITL